MFYNSHECYYLIICYLAYTRQGSYCGPPRQTRCLCQCWSSGGFSPPRLHCCIWELPEISPSVGLPPPCATKSAPDFPPLNQELLEARSYLTRQIINAKRSVYKYTEGECIVCECTGCETQSVCRRSSAAIFIECEGKGVKFLPLHCNRKSQITDGAERRKKRIFYKIF